MRRTALALVVIGGAIVLVTKGAQQNTATPQSFEGTWQGLGQGYSVRNHTERASQLSMTLMLTVKVSGEGKLFGTAKTSGVQRPAPQGQTPRLVLGAPPPPVAPPPPPLPVAPPSGEILNPRIEGRALLFEVKGPDTRLVDFRLNLQGPAAGILSVTSKEGRGYPEFPMKRMP